MLLLVGALNLRAQGTAFTYQGRLNDGINPANGTYNLRFALFDALTVGNQVGSPLTNSPVNVSNGLFTVTLDFGANFPGADRWLEIGVRTNGSGTFFTLSPRQKITPSPYAIYAAGASAAGISGTIPNANLTGTYGSAVTFSNPANSFSGNGTGLSNVNALSLGGFGASSFWNLGGNAGTAPGTQFLGTTDNQPLELKVNNQRALRLEPNPNAPNMIGGSAANEVTNGIYGAVIAGGGSTSYPNRVGANFGTVVGGAGNTASGNSATAMGQFNTASGYAGTAMGYSTVAAGFGSQAGGTTAKANHDGTFVWADNNFSDFTSTAANQFLIRAAGGVGINNNNPNGAALAVNGNVTVNNTIGTPGNQPLELKVNNQRGLRLEPTTNADTVNVIGGSARNFVGVGVVGATIGGGGSGNYYGDALTNRVDADYGTVSGGTQNTIQPNAQNATIGGGFFNTIQNLSAYSIIGGGFANTIQNNVAYSVIGGGLGNMIQTNTIYGTIGGGDQNTIQDYVNYSIIGGGVLNTIQSAASAATLGGGYQNTIGTHAYCATLGGGFGNSIQTFAFYATLGGGDGNSIQNDAEYATIGGGAGNTIQSGADYATIPGGLANSATNYAFAAGSQAKANHTGAFVWADSTVADFASTANNQFLIRASGGVGINKNNPAATLDVNGTARIQGANNWNVTGGEGDFRVGNDSYRFKIGIANGGGGAGDVWMRAHGGTARVFIKTPGGTTFYSNEGETAGVSLAANGTAWAVVSDRNVKKDIVPVNQRKILEKLAALPITQWHYKWESPDVTPHIGPMAQDFKAAFYPGTDDKSITTQEADGVALAAIQGLNQKVEEQRAENAELKQRLEKLEQLMNHKNGGAK
jgi:hypothetical protein